MTESDLKTFIDRFATLAPSSRASEKRRLLETNGDAILALHRRELDLNPLRCTDRDQPVAGALAPAAERGVRPDQQKTQFQFLDHELHELIGADLRNARLQTRGTRVVYPDISVRGLQCQRGRNLPVRVRGIAALLHPEIRRRTGSRRRDARVGGAALDAAGSTDTRAADSCRVTGSDAGAATATAAMTPATPAAAALTDANGRARLDEANKADSATGSIAATKGTSAAVNR